MKITENLYKATLDLDLARDTIQRCMQEGSTVESIIILQIIEKIASAKSLVAQLMHAKELDDNEEGILQQRGNKEGIMKKGYYQANTISGVTFYDTHMDLDIDVLDANVFYNALRTISDNETIYGFFDDFGIHDMEVLEQIEKEYGMLLK